ncbi:MAG: hypothetical protein GXO39_04310 [Thermotogae bacterium]|nr:hypothetical protein [Thermotogota bacterium]
MERDLRRLIKEVDVLLLLAEKGRESRRIFAWQMFIWGFYTFLNMGYQLLGRLFHLPFVGVHWFLTLFLALYLSTVNMVGWKRSFLWFVPAVLTVMAYGITGSYIVSMITFAVAITLVSWLIYGAGENRMNTIGRVGLMWGIFMGAFWWNVFLYPPLFKTEVFNLWITYVLGVGLTISGLIFRPFLYVGLLVLFGLPFLFLSGEWSFLTGYSLTGLMMGILGLWNYLKLKRNDRGS